MCFGVVVGFTPAWAAWHLAQNIDYALWFKPFTHVADGAENRG